MKKIILMLTVGSTILFSANNISGVTYFQYNADNGFEMKRTYFTYKNTISDELSFKFQTDVGTVGDDDRWTAFLKKAQLDYKISSDMKMTMGLIGMNMFNVQEKTWGNRFIYKSAMDQNKWSASADLGIGLTKKFGSIAASLLMTNGEGYKHMDVDDNLKMSLQVLYGTAKLNKKDGFNVGMVWSSYTTPEVDADPGINVWNLCDAAAETESLCVVADDDGYWTIEEASEAEEEKEATVMGIFGGWAANSLRIGGEYHSMSTSRDSSDDIDGELTSIYANYKIKDNLSVFARMDNHDDDVDDNNDAVETTIAGFIWTPTKGLDICPNMTKVGDGDNTLALNFQFKF